MPEPIIAPALALPGIVHGFFTRAGGVSTGIYESLNCGLGSADDLIAVAENRARVAATLGATALVTPHQAHTAEAVIVDAPFAGPPPRADALVTSMPGLAVAVLAADCAPLLFADAAAGVVGAAHAGWRGAKAGIVAATIAAMERLGARRERIVMAVGPCIGPADYEVGLDFKAAFLADDAGAAAFFSAGPRGKPHFALEAFILAQGRGLGLMAAEGQALSTFADPAQFFSYRRAMAAGDADYGRQISAIRCAPCG